MEKGEGEGRKLEVSTRNLLKCYRTFVRQTENSCRTELKSVQQDRNGIYSYKEQGYDSQQVPAVQGF